MSQQRHSGRREVDQRDVKLSVPGAYYSRVIRRKREHVSTHIVCSESLGEGRTKGSNREDIAPRSAAKNSIDVDVAILTQRLCRADGHVLDVRDFKNIAGASTNLIPGNASSSVAVGHLLAMCRLMPVTGQPKKVEPDYCNIRIMAGVFVPYGFAGSVIIVKGEGTDPLLAINRAKRLLQNDNSCDIFVNRVGHQCCSFVSSIFAKNNDIIESVPVGKLDFFNFHATVPHINLGEHQARRRVDSSLIVIAVSTVRRLARVFVDRHTTAVKQTWRLDRLWLPYAEEHNSAHDQHACF